MPRHYIYIGIMAVACLLTLSGYILLRRPFLVPQATNAADREHAYPAYGETSVGQQFTLSNTTLGAIDIAIDSKTNLPDDTPLVLFVHFLGEDAPVRRVQTTWLAAQEPLPRVYNNKHLELLAESPVAHFAFEPLKVAEGQIVDINLTAPAASRQNPLWVRYQIDDSKFNGGQAIVNRETKTRDLGFTLYEQPTVLNLLTRWLVNPEHHTVWFGLGALCAGLILIAWQWRKPPKSHQFWQEGWQTFSWRHLLPWFILLSIAVFVLYWPALQLFHWQDDVLKLVRVKYFSDEPLKLLFTNHRYFTSGNEPAFPVGFYRPVSLALYPWFLWQLAGPSPLLYHVGSLVIFSLCAGALFIFSFLLLRSAPLSFLATLIWTAHSSKAALAYWWSSTEDSLGTLFILLTLLFYTRWRANPIRRWLVLTVISFILAVFSKEHAVILLLLIPLLELCFQAGNLQTRLLSASKLWSWLLGIGGIYLIARTIAINDPTLPVFLMKDRSYDIALSPLVFLKNALVYSAWSAENWLWHDNVFFNRLFAWFETFAHTFMWRVDAAPYFPGILLLLVYAALLAFSWRRQTMRRLLLFTGGWWVITLLPNLLLESVWSSRWLTLATWSMSILIPVALQLLKPRWKYIQWSIVSMLTIAVFAYGFWAARLPARVDQFTNLSYFTEAAVQRFQSQEKKLSPNSTIHLVGIPSDARGSVNANLFWLYSDKPFKTVTYSDAIPTGIATTDIVIDMRDQEAF